MATAIRTYTREGVLQLDSDMANFRVIAAGTAPANLGNSGMIQIPQMSTCPILMVRLKPNAAAGGFTTKLDFWNDVRYSVMYGANNSFDWVLASTEGEPMLFGDGKVGIKIYNRGGHLIFSSQYRYPRITAIEEIYPPAPNTFASSKTISGWDEMPWIIVNDLIWSLQGNSGEGTGSPPCLFSIRINDTFDTMTVETREDWAFNNLWPFRQQYNPFRSRPMRIPLCKIAGF